MSEEVAMTPPPPAAPPPPGGPEQPRSKGGQYREMTDADWKDLAMIHKKEAERLRVENKNLRDALRRLRDAINHTLETGRA